MRVLSLFSGCGGMDLGLEGDFWCLKKSVRDPDWITERSGDWVKVSPTGFVTVFANDIRPDAQKAWTTYFATRMEHPENVYHLQSIVDLVKEAKAGKKVLPDDIDVVSGGFPCNDFSVSGLRLGFESHKSHLGTALSGDEPTIESRGMLYMWMRDVITLTEPKLFIAENVKGLTNLADVKEIIEHDFRTAGGDGYIVVPAKVLYAADYGVPQSRERVIFFGFKKSALRNGVMEELMKDVIDEAYDPYPKHTHEKDEYVTCRDAFIGLKEPEEATDPAQMKYSKAKYMGAHCQGQREVNLDAVGPTIRAEHHGNIEYRRLSEEHGGTHKEELAAGLQERRLTVRECARLQTFPDDYQFVIPGRNGLSASDAYKIIGNAVPPVMAYNIARSIMAKWDLYFKED